MKILFYTGKGGVGKSTSVMNLGVALAKRACGCCSSISIRKGD